MSKPHPHPHSQTPAHSGPERPAIEREFELERLVLFSDAVFAIAITLLVIDIKWPEIPAGADSAHQRDLMLPMIYEFGAFVISFYFIGTSWAGNLRLFRLMQRYDQKLIRLNLLFLFFIVTFPFTAAGIAHMLTNFTFGLPIFLYTGNIFLVALMHYRVSLYLFRKNPALSVPGRMEEKKLILLKGKFNVIGLGLTCIVLWIVAQFTSIQVYLNIMGPLYILQMFILKRLTNRTMATHTAAT